MQGIVPSTRNRIFQGGTFQSLFLMMSVLTGVALVVMMVSMLLRFCMEKKQYRKEKDRKDHEEMRKWHRRMEQQQTGALM